MYGIMHNLHEYENYATDFNQVRTCKHPKTQSVKHFILVPSMALYGAGNWCYSWISGCILNVNVLECFVACPRNTLYISVIRVKRILI